MSEERAGGRRGRWLLDDPPSLYFPGRHTSLESIRLEYYDGIEEGAVRIREMLEAQAGS